MNEEVATSTSNITYYTQYAASGTGLVGRYQNSGTCSMSVCLPVCMWDTDFKKFTVSH